MSRESVWETSGVTGGTGFYVIPKGTLKWVFQPWSKIQEHLRPKTRAEAVALLAKWKKEIGATYAMVQCGQCHRFHGGISNWEGAICDDCPTGDYQMVCSKCGIYCNKNWFGNPALCSNCHEVKARAVAKAMGIDPPKSNVIRRTVGEVWKHVSGSSPFNSEQWGYQGSAKVPYVITHYHARVDGSTTGDGWACSCMNFTRNVPRTPCKHVLNVMLKEGVTPKGVTPKSAKINASLTDADAAQFEKWKREQAEKKEVKPTGEFAGVGATGRKFR